jgi:hypothetical protein
MNDQSPLAGTRPSAAASCTCWTPAFPEAEASFQFVEDVFREFWGDKPVCDETAVEILAVFWNDVYRVLKYMESMKRPWDAPLIFLLMGMLPPTPSRDARMKALIPVGVESRENP